MLEIDLDAQVAVLKLGECLLSLDFVIFENTYKIKCILQNKLRHR